MTENSAEWFMARALQIAAFGLGKVSPNPLVGAVITLENQIIGEGWHQTFGENHAEVNAILSVKKQDLLEKSTVYVNVEPCSHFGKTPPCADLLINKKVKKVVIANQDPNPKVAGKGIAKLLKAGIIVQTGVLADEGDWLNRRFFTFFRKKRPYIILKWAETQDGFIAKENLDSKWISNPLARTWVHRWRSEEDAILVGKNTILYDNPQLNVRFWQGKNPLRVVLDTKAEIPQTCAVFDGTIPTVCYTAEGKPSKSTNLEFVTLDTYNLHALLHDLFQRNIQSLFVEGGATVLQSFLEAGLWDEIRRFKGNVYFGKGIASPKFEGKLLHSKQLGKDTLEIFSNQAQEPFKN